MGDIAQLPVNLSTEVTWIEYHVEFQWATLPNSLSTILTTTLANGSPVSMGDIAQLPVNTSTNSSDGCSQFQWATLPNSLSTSLINRFVVVSCFNGRHCPTPCQRWLPWFWGKRCAVSMGDIAQLPVNPHAATAPVWTVSMGDIAQLPVNQVDAIQKILCFNGRHCPTPCQLTRYVCWTSICCFNGRHCPTPCQQWYLAPTLDLKFQWATLPNSLSTKQLDDNRHKERFQWATLPNSLSTLWLC